MHSILFILLGLGCQHIYTACNAAGKAKYDAKKHALVWKIKRFTGQTESALVASVELIATTREKKAWAKPPINMSFQVVHVN